MMKPPRPFLLSFHWSRHRSTLFHACPGSSTHVPISLQQKTIMLTKETTNVTKKTSSCSIASAHSTLPSGAAPIPSAYPEVCPHDIDIGCANGEHAERHLRISTNSTRITAVPVSQVSRTQQSCEESSLTFNRIQHELRKTRANYRILYHTRNDRAR